MKLFRIALISAVGILSLLTWQATAQAHASYDHSNPSDKQVLAASPSQLTITFVSAIAVAPGTFAAVTNGDLDATLGSGLPSPTNPDTLVVPLKPNLPAGKYFVFWKSTDADDGGVTFGRFTFFIGSPSPSDVAAADPGASVAVPDAATQDALNPFGTTGNQCAATDSFCFYCQNHTDSDLCPKSSGS